MGQIDDPFDQIEFEHRDEPPQGLSVALNVAAPIIGLLTNPVGAAVATIGAFAAQFTAEHRRESRAAAFQEGLRDGFKGLNGRLDTLEKKVVGPDVAINRHSSTRLQATWSLVRTDRPKGHSDKRPLAGTVG